MNNGWIKLHRQIRLWEWYTQPETAHLFIHLLLNANHEPKKWKGILIERGQVIIGRKELSKQTGLTERQVRTSLQRLEETQELTIKTTNKFSIVTVLKYDFYQLQENSAQQNANKRPTNDQQTTTNKNVKNYKNQNNNVVFEKSLLRWLRQQGKTEKYARWMLTIAPIEIIEKAWNKVIGGKAVNSPSDFVDFCKTLNS